MFIRTKKNKSGSTSVMAIESVRLSGKTHPIPRVIKNFGSANNDKDIAALQEEAKQYVLNFSKTDVSVLSGLIIKHGSDINSCTTRNIGFSGIFDNLYRIVFGGLHINKSTDKIIKDLAIMRIIDPKSKRRTAYESGNYGFDLKLQNVYKAMDKLDDDVIKQIKKLAYKNTTRLLDKLDLIFYDLTTVSFETNCQDDLRDFGFSKDGKHQHVQIVLALVITKHGLPVDYELFQGNTYEGNTLITVLKDLKVKHKIDKITVVADSGLISKHNVSQLNQLGFNYILGGRIKSCSRQIQSSVFDSDYTDLNEDLRCKVHSLSDTEELFIYHSEKRAEKDAYDRNRAIEKIKKCVGTNCKTKLSGTFKKPYVKISSESVIEIDQSKLDKVAKFDGYFSLQTNIKDKAIEIFNCYKGLWQIEQTFRISKHNLRIRPVFHYSLRRIKAHFAICYMSLAMLRTLEYMTQKENCYIPIEQLFLLLDKVMVTQININKKAYNVLNDFPDELTPIYKCVKTKIPVRLTLAG